MCPHALFSQARSHMLNLLNNRGVFQGEKLDKGAFGCDEKDN